MVFGFNKDIRIRIRIPYKNEQFEIFQKVFFRAHKESLCREHNLIKLQDKYYMAIYSKLINNNLPHYFETFTLFFLQDTITITSQSK